MIRAKTETEDLLLSITENFEQIIKQTHTRAEQTLEFKLTQPRRTFFKPSFNLGLGSKWMVGLKKFRSVMFYFYYNRREQQIRTL